MITKNYSSDDIHHRARKIGHLVEEEICLRNQGFVPSNSVKREKELIEDCKENIAAIASALQSSDAITSKMLSKLDYFSTKVNGAIETIQTVQMDIKLREKKREDISRAVGVIENILEMYEKIEDVSEQLKSKDVEVFLASQDRLTESVEYLRRNSSNIGAAEKLAELEKLQKLAKLNLSKHYQELLKSVSGTQTLSHLLKVYEETHQFPLAVHFIPSQEKLNLLQKLISRSMVVDNSGTIKEYVTRRSSFLVDTILYTFGIKFECVVEESNEKKSSHFDDKKFRKSMHLPGIFVADKGNDSDHSPLPASKEKFNLKRCSNAAEVFLTPDTTTNQYERNSCLFLRYIDLMVVTLRSEAIVTKYLFPASYSSVFDKETTEFLNIFTEISTIVLKSLLSCENRMWATRVLLDLYSNKDRNAIQMAEVADPSFSEQHSQVYQGHVNSLKETIIETFKNVLAVNVKQQLKPLPSDGTVHPVTSFVISYLANMIEFKQLINDNNLIVIIHKPTSLKTYIKKCIDDLRENILSTRKNNVLSYIFELNNYNFIWKRAQEPLLASEVGRVELLKYSTWVDEQEALYFTCWSACITALGDDFKPTNKKFSMAPTTSQQIKERFNTFNSELESLFETQKTLYIGDEELRERMKNGIRSMLIQRYVDCREKYEKVNFSKDNKNKYLAYNAETLEDMISQFFEGHFSTKKTKYT